MDFVSRFIPLLPLLLTISFLHHQVVAGDLVAKTCDDAVNEQLCVQTLQADPRSKQADLSGLAEIAIKSAMDAGAKISDEVKNLHAKATNSFDKPRLKDCTDQYLSATEQLEDALSALHSKGYSDATTWIQAAMTDSETCEEGFKEEPGHKSPLKEKSTNFQQLCGNALAIANMLIGV